MSERPPQLIMRKPSLDDLPPLILPEGFSIHTHDEKLDSLWEDLVEKSFGYRFSFDKFVRNGGHYRPEYVFYLAENGRDIATATAVEKDEFPGEGWFRMVGTLPEARGRGAGKLVCTAALHSLRERGYHSCLLSTDDHRIPAIRLYLSLGFRPYMTHESHPARWEAIMKTLGREY